MNYYQRRKWRDRAIVSLVIAAVLAFIVVIFTAVWYTDQEKRAECEATGGRIVEVHGTRDNGWMCWR